MTVYVVTSGRYSDYHVVCVRGTREEADDIVTQIDDDARVEEFDTEGHPYAGDGMFWWEIRGWVHLDHVDASLSEGREIVPPVFTAYDEGRTACVHGDVRAFNGQHALKIASEKRAELIAWFNRQGGRP